MALTRVHNFAISLDGYGTGEGQSADAHFGHAGDRLHQWMFATRWWDPAGSGGVDDAFVQRHDPGIGAEIIEMEGGTTFHFLDATPDEALAAAREAADGKDVRIGGGPTVVNEFLAAGLIDHLHVVVVPILLGRGVRLWDGLEGLEKDYRVEATSSSSNVTHVTFTRAAS
ncbi:dihydrofolate reductase family protein [Jiangella sp. DSM 45060]|uniref:dihydrofolate reductase family protein n=1 Tax=Jiangella sp. DSM 45060 TaxID=1798224 RepID=UPI00087CCF68|nr:dihydrofolate reductase family protein [Jiangella sp. DSM 45060]SDS55130.1 Dihydrofolate reductase [Jiangella sp. DSM 45060]